MYKFELAVPAVGRLDVVNPHWARVDLGDLGGADPRQVLAGTVDLPDAKGVADAGKVGDLVPTYWAALFLVTPAFRTVLSDAGLTGWSTTPLLVTGNSAALDLTLLHVRGRCGPARSLGVGSELDPGNWDGSDLFLVDGDSTVYLSPRARRVLSSAHLRNVETDLAGFDGS